MGYYFISYSRYDVTFVNSFAAHLEKHGLEVWLDFRNLWPGKTWQEQLDDAVNYADAVLLVVTPHSVTSPAVQDEWSKALNAKKRIVLLIFQAVALPPELQACESVDFRGSFEKALHKLEALLKREPLPIRRSVTQTGWKIPPTPRLVTVLACVVAFISLPGLLAIADLLRSLIATWQPTDTLTHLAGTLVFVGILLLTTIRLLRLPLQITRRTYHFGNAQAALLLSLLFSPIWVIFLVVSVWKASSELPKWLFELLISLIVLANSVTALLNA